MHNIAINISITKKTYLLYLMIMLFSAIVFIYPLYGDIKEKRAKYSPFNSGFWGYSSEDKYYWKKLSFKEARDAASKNNSFTPFAYYYNDLPKSTVSELEFNKCFLDTEFDNSAFVLSEKNEVIGIELNMDLKNAYKRDNIISDISVYDRLDYMEYVPTKFATIQTTFESYPFWKKYESKLEDGICIYRYVYDEKDEYDDSLKENEKIVHRLTNPNIDLIMDNFMGLASIKLRCDYNIGWESARQKLEIEEAEKKKK